MRARDDPKAFVPIGTGHAGAMFRTGLAELRNALYPESNVAVGHAEAGIVGTATQFEVNQVRQGEPLAKVNEGSSIVDDRIKQAEAARDTDSKGRESPDMERE